MPRKSKVRRSKKSSRKKTDRLQSIRDRFSRFKWTDSYNSFLLGIVAVIIAVLFVTSIICQQNRIQQTSSISTGPTPSIVATVTPGTTLAENGSTYYVVKDNDSLWNISTNLYNDGYKWNEIAKLNNLVNPDLIYKGDKLLLPEKTPSSLGQVMQNEVKQNPATIMGNAYTVVRDDTLWDIAVRAYGDGYRWVDIAKVNNLANPDLIFSGNVFKIPR